MAKGKGDRITTQNSNMTKNIIRTNVATSLTERQIWDCPQLLLTHKTICREHLPVPQNTPRGLKNFHGNGVLPLTGRKICDCLKEQPKPKIYNSNHMLLKCAAGSDTKILAKKVKKSCGKNLIPPCNTPIEYAHRSDMCYQSKSYTKYINIIEEPTSTTKLKCGSNHAKCLPIQSELKQKKSSTTNCASKSKQHLPNQKQRQHWNKLRSLQPDVANSIDAIIARKLTRKLNFPRNVSIFKNLISLNVEDHEPPPTKNKTKSSIQKFGKPPSKNPPKKS
ncbi:uncharacterized protein LOC119687156 [Teleopsis dalmanni]|uniref:uncharacterized protein LOC119687156 n=1 Tax=Teleopsis dalmanni TaxID=139649 RepID=UPI0018CCD051|nr:uncharacterized protein LOC119687156 [Teleopsis dalmanni]